MHSESSAFVNRSVVVGTDSSAAHARPAGAARDVRIVRLIDDSHGERLLQRLLASGVHGRLLASPTVTRTAPAVSEPWLRSLHSVRVPVRAEHGRQAATGYIELMSVGVGTTEVTVCLAPVGRKPRSRSRRQVQRLADDIAARLIG